MIRDGDLSLSPAFERYPLTKTVYFLRSCGPRYIIPLQTRTFIHTGSNFFNTTMAKMTKSQLMSELAAKTNMSKKDATMFVETLVNMALKNVKTNGEFVIPGMGKLVKVKRAARMGRNPATGAEIKIPAKTVVKFRVAKAAKEAVL